MAKSINATCQPIGSSILQCRYSISANHDESLFYGWEMTASQLWQWRMAQSVYSDSLEGSSKCTVSGNEMSLGVWYKLGCSETVENYIWNRVTVWWWLCRNTVTVMACNPVLFILYSVQYDVIHLFQSVMSDALKPVVSLLPCDMTCGCPWLYWPKYLSVKYHSV